MTRGRSDYNKPFADKNIPNAFRERLLDWIFDGTYPGSYLEAVLSDSLMKAFTEGTDVDTSSLPRLTLFLYNDAPALCWGSPERFRAWTEKGGLNGKPTEVTPEPVPRHDAPLGQTVFDADTHGRTANPLNELFSGELTLGEDLDESLPYIVQEGPLVFREFASGYAVPPTNLTPGTLVEGLEEHHEEPTRGVWLTTRFEGSKARHVVAVIDRECNIDVRVVEMREVVVMLPKTWATSEPLDWATLPSSPVVLTAVIPEGETPESLSEKMKAADGPSSFWVKGAKPWFADDDGIRRDLLGISVRLSRYLKLVDVYDSIPRRRERLQDILNRAWYHMSDGDQRRADMVSMHNRGS